MYRRIFKPFIDVSIACMGCLLLFPVFLFIALILAIVNQGSPFFLQLRPGKNGRLFEIIKFKTMTGARDKDGVLLPDAQRLTSVGRFIRKTSLDEIPQLINILKGDMSLVGPRPLLPEYLEIYSDVQKQRHLVRPGITGWAQVNGRNAISWTKKIEYDLWYVNHISLSLDVKIIWKTFLKVIRSEGINTANMATTEPFNGNN